MSRMYFASMNTPLSGVSSFRHRAASPDTRAHAISSASSPFASHDRVHASQPQRLPSHAGPGHSRAQVHGLPP